MPRLKYSSPSLKLSLAAAGSLTAAALLSGCAGLSTTASPAVADAVSGSMSGHIYGGNQPVSNSDVRLYAAGVTGYGSSPTLYASTSTANDGFGSFSFSQKPGTGITSGGSTPVYGCPTDGTDPQMYLSARGGNTQGAGNGSNSAASFILALGKCSTIATGFYDLNEITTVATIASLQQYFSPANANTDNIAHLGMPATTQAQLGYANGVATISNIANVSDGTLATRSFTATPTGATSAVTVTITPEAAKINTIADIISACVNTTSSTSSGCQTLFANAAPPSSANTSQPSQSFGTATTSTSALWNMLTNPTSGSAANLQNLFNLVNPQSPFQPTEATAPTDWTIGLRYSSTSSCGTGATFLNSPYRLAVDASGSVFVASSATGGNVSGISPSGTPTLCAFSGAGAIGGITFGTQGNLWVTNTVGANVIRYTPSTGTTTSFTTPNTGNSVIHGDGAGNIVFTTSNSSNTSLYSFPLGSTATNPTATLISSTIGVSPTYFEMDTANRAFLSSTTTSNAFYDVYPTNSSFTTYATVNVGTSQSAWDVSGVEAGLASTVIAVNGGLAGSSISNTLSVFTPSSTNGVVPLTTITSQFSGGLNSPTGVAVDGAGNIWVANTAAASGNYVTGATTSGLFSVSEFTNAAYALSPTGGGTSAVNGGFQKDASVLPVAPRSVAVDPTGNVWFGSANGTGNGLLELVGAAVPVVTPIPVGLAAGSATGNAVQKP